MADHLKEESLNWALAHVRRFGDTDLFPVPFEFQALAKAWSKVLPDLLAIDLAVHVCGPHRPSVSYPHRVPTR